MKKFLAVVGLVIFIAGQIGNLWASGFYIQDHDPKAQAQGGAFTAQADNPSAVWYNPAGMSQLDSTQISVNSNFIRLETKYENPQGLKQDLDAEWAAVPNAFITSDLGTEKWTVGLGLTCPFGLTTKWSKDGLLRYAATSTSFKMIAVNPAVAFQIVDQFSLAAGVDYYNVYSYTAESKYNFVIGDADVKNNVDGDGWGFNLGTLWQPHPKHSFGLTYRSRVAVDLDGSLKYKNIPAGLGYPATLAYDVSSKITLPSIISGGYAFRPIEKLKLELDVWWLEWSTLDEVKIKDKASDTYLNITDKDWSNNFMIDLGGEYIFNEYFTGRAGYSYCQNAVPEKTFSPDVPDTNLNIIALGLGINLNKFTIDLAYSLGLYQKRDIDNDVGASVGTTVDGEYKTHYHNIAVGVSYKF